MIYLILSILCSTFILITFKLFKRFNIDTLQAIIYNYITCTIVGCIALQYIPIDAQNLQSSWFPFALMLGFIFIGGFYISALTIQVFGITLATIMQKMSLVLTVIFVVWYFRESLNILKITGILSAIAAIFFVNHKSSEDLDLKAVINKNRWYILLPFLTFAIAGIVEINLQYVQVKLLTPQTGQLEFTTLLFGVAATIGVIILIFNLLTKKMTFQLRHLLAGIILGIPNYGSIYFMLMVLSLGWEGSVVFPITNVSVILLSAFAGIWYFKEKATPFRVLGITTAMIAILLIAIS